jgi:hypothetical protein
MRSTCVVQVGTLMQSPNLVSITIHKLDQVSFAANREKLYAKLPRKITHAYLIIHTQAYFAGRHKDAYD